MDLEHRIQAEHKKSFLTRHQIDGEKTADLNLANEKLVELNSLKTEFYTSITHEFRTPLTSIKSQIDAVRQGHFGETIESSSTVFESLEQNVTHLTKLIDNLLDFSKIKSGRMNLFFDAIYLPDYLHFIYANFESAMEHKGLSFKYIEDTQGGGYALIDKNLFEKALYNLLSNAIKYTPRGGTVSLLLTETENNILVSVKDTGRGIAREHHEQIFERYHHRIPADTPSAEGYEGAGIGLALTQKVVELHKGSIEVESEPGKGATFTIKLPAYLPTEGEGQTISRRAEIHLENNGQKLHLKVSDEIPAPVTLPYTVLIVEDNNNLLSFLKKIISPEFHVLTAQNGLEALDLLDKAAPDLVVSDIMMPEMNGLELLQRIRFDRDLKWLPVIMLTARTDFSMKLYFFSHGANDYIVKPFKVDELLARVKSQLPLVRLWREYCAELNRKNNKKLTDSTIVAIEKIQDYIKANYRKTVSREKLASMIKMSPDHLSRMFKKHTGMTIKAFINELRVEGALEKLTTSDGKIIDIAFEAGFESLGSFNRIFKKNKGMTPSEYRKLNWRGRTPRQDK